MEGFSQKSVSSDASEYANTSASTNARAASRDKIGRSRKRLYHGSEHRKSIIKHAKLRHKEHINHRGNLIPARTSNFIPNLKCGKKCTSVPDGLKEELLKNFLRCRTKNEQDIHLFKSITLIPSQKRRFRDLGNDRKRTIKERCGSYKYHLSGSDGHYVVCKRCFVNVYGITESRVKRIQNCFVNGKAPKDKRGAGRSANAVPEETFQNVKDHIASFPVHQSHYKDEDYFFLNPKLTVKKMCEMYNEKYPDKVSYWYYLKVFNEEFSLRFKPPSVDVCNKCEELSVKIQSKELSDEEKKPFIVQKLLHIRRANKFYKKIREVQTLSQAETDVLGISFDFMQNLYLPCIPVQSTFYLRQLTVSVFSINNLKTNGVKFFVYDECVGGKGPNDVASLLWNYVQNDIPKTVKKLHIFCDNCPAQNKNHPVLNFFMSLVQSRFESVHMYFPMRGHSFLPNDRSYANVKRYLRKNGDRVYTVRQYGILIAHALHMKYEVMFVKPSDFYDIKRWCLLHYKKAVSSEETKNKRKTEQEKFQISKYSHLEIHRTDPGKIYTREFIDQAQLRTFVLRKRRKDCEIPLDFPTLREQKTLKTEKVTDLLKFRPYILDKPSIKQFWNWRVKGFWLM